MEIQQLHSQLSAGLDIRVHLVSFALTYKCQDGRRAYHCFKSRDPALSILTHEKGLRDNGLQSRRKLHPYLLLLVWLEYVDNAVDRLRRVGGMEGCKHEVARFRGGNGKLNCLQVAHLPNQDH